MKTQDFKKTVTENIIKQMETCGTDWARSWIGSSNGLPSNVESKNHYNGINILLLMMEEKPSSVWATYPQWVKQNRQVKKGEKATRIVFFKQIKTEDKKTGEKNTFPMMKQYNVFNESQLEDYQAEEGQGETFNRADVAKFIYNTEANIYHEGDKAYYRPSNDQIVLPAQEDFKNTEEASAEQNYYGTLFHELTHWTGNTNRLDRLKQKTSREDYAFEELIAELGATFLNVHFGIESTPRADHAKYLKAWLQALENDNGLIFRASAKAGQAFDYLEKLQDQDKQRKSA